MRRLILFGAPGSGKGTMGDFLARDFGYPKISTGDILRSEIERGSAAGLKAKGFMDAGGLVPDDMVIAMVRRRLEEGDLNSGYVMDGYPRTLAQARELSLIACDREQAIFIEVTEAEAVERLMSRLTCGGCGAIYNTKNKPPRKAGVCDLCGGSVGRRADDNAEAVRRRFRVYAERTLPVIEYYGEKGVLSRIDGSGPAVQAYGRIKGVLS